MATAFNPDKYLDSNTLVRTDEGFNPDAYLQDSSLPPSFDPDSYLADSSQLSDKSQRFAQSTVENAADTVAGLNRANQAVMSGVDDVFNKVVLTAADAGLTDFAVFLRNKQDQFRSAAKTGGMRGESLAQFMQEAAQGYQPDPARDKEFLSKVAQGAGSLPAIIAGGVIPGAQVVTGGAMMGEQGYQEAVAAAPEEQTAAQKERTGLRAFTLNAGTTAASEALLGVPALLRSVAAAKEPAKGAVELIGRALWQGVKGVFREGAQEGLEQVGQNLIAKELYDPNRPVDQGVIDSILVGGVIGGPFSAAVEAGNEALKRTAAQVGPVTEQVVSSSTDQPVTQTIDSRGLNDPVATDTAIVAPPTDLEIDERGVKMLSQQQQNSWSKLTSKIKGILKGVKVGLGMDGAMAYGNTVTVSPELYEAAENNGGVDVALPVVLFEEVAHGAAHETLGQNENSFYSSLWNSLGSKSKNVIESAYFKGLSTFSDFVKSQKRRYSKDAAPSDEDVSIQGGAELFRMLVQWRLGLRITEGLQRTKDSPTDPNLKKESNESASKRESSTRDVLSQVWESLSNDQKAQIDKVGASASGKFSEAGLSGQKYGATTPPTDLESALASEDLDAAESLLVNPNEAFQTPADLLAESESLEDVALQDLQNADANTKYEIDYAARQVFMGDSQPIDDIFNPEKYTKRPELKESADKMYGAFEKTRNALRRQFGNTVTLYRMQGEGDQSSVSSGKKTTLNFAATPEIAAQYENYGGKRKLVEKTVPIDQVVAVNVGPKGGYQEFIVLNDATDFYKPYEQTEDIAASVQSEAVPTDDANAQAVVDAEPLPGVEAVAETTPIAPLFVSNNDGHTPIIEQWTPALNESGITPDKVKLAPNSPNAMRVNWDAEGNPLLEINPEATARLAPEALEAVLHEELVHTEHINSFRNSWNKEAGPFQQHMEAEMGKIVAEGRALGLNIEASQIYGDPTFSEGFEIVRQLVQGRKAGTVTEAQVNPQNAPTIWKLLNDLLDKFKTLLANNPNSTIAEYVKNIEIALYGESDLETNANQSVAPPGSASTTRDETNAALILADLESNDVSPKDVVDQFWSEAYPNLPEATQQRIQQQIKAVTGSSVGDVIASQNGQDVAAKDWSEIYGPDQAASTIEDLQGNERGLIALMEAANRGYGQVQNNPLTPPGAAPSSAPAPIPTPAITRDKINFFQRTLNPYFWGGKEKLKLIGQGEAAFNTLSNALLVHEDTRSKIQGRLKNGYLNWLQSTTSAQRKIALPEVFEYIRLRESRDGGKTAATALSEANTALSKASPAAQRLVDWLHTTARATGDTSEALGVMVNQGGIWRPLQNLKEMHWPRMMSRRTWEILANPDTDQNAADSMKLYQEMVSNGNASSVAEAKQMLLTESGDMKNGDFFANVEKARGMKLPDAYYDYSIEAYMGFLDRYADRIGQIQAYGQSLGGKKKTAWDNARAATNDGRIKDYVTNLEQVITRTQAKDPGLVTDIFQKVRSGATMFYLSAPFTATRNLMSSMVNTAEQAGYRNMLKATGKAFYDSVGAIAKTGMNFSNGNLTVAEPKIVGEYGKIGAVARDIQAMMAWDSYQDDSGIPLSRLDENIQKSTKFALTLQGMTERLGRSINAAGSYSWGKDAMKAINANEKSGESKRAIAKLAELGITGPKLTQWLAGDPARWDEYLRMAVRSKQYGYTATQSPIIFDNEMAKFFTQFMKWGAQRASDVARNVIAPAMGRDIELPSGASARVHDFGPLTRYLLASLVLGEGFALLSQFLSDKERKEASVEEIQNTWTEDQWRGGQIAFDRLSRDIVMSGALGIFGDLYGGLKEKVLQPGKAKDLVNPPGISVVNDLKALASNVLARAGTAITTQDMQSLYDGLQRDILNYFKTQPAITQAKGITQQVMKVALGEDSDNEILRLRAAEADKALARNLGQRYVDENGLPRKENFGGATVPGKYSEISTQISEQVSMGDAKQARELLQGFLGRIKPEDRKAALQSIKASVGQRAPLASVFLTQPTEIGQYLAWVKKRVPSQHERVKEAVMRYMITQKQAGL